MPSRRAVIAGAAGLGLVGTGVGVSSQVPLKPFESWTPSADTWPLPRYGPANTAGNANASAPTNPTVVWMMDTGVESEHPYASVVVGPDTVYVGGERVVALDRRDGTIRWTHDLPGHDLGLRRGTLYAGPVYSGFLFTYDSTGLTAFDARDGQQRWQTDNDKGDITHLVIAGSTVVVGYWNETLAAYDARNGSRLWSLSETGLGSSPMVHDGTLYAATRRLVRFRPRSKLDSVFQSGPTPAWRSHFSVDPDLPTIGHNNVIYGGSWATDEPAVWAVNRTDGSLAWGAFHSDTDRLAARTPAVVGDRGYTALRYGGNADPHHHAVGAVDLADGSVVWHRRVNQRVTDLAATGDAVIVATAENPHHDPSSPGAVRALDLDDGSELWRVEVEGAVYTIAVVDGAVFARVGTGQVIALQ